MSPGRNDPCPCGSGKKYKKCCIEKDEAARSKALQATLEPPPGAAPAANETSTPPWKPPPPPPVDPERERLKALMETIDQQFREADLDGKLHVYRKAMDEPDYWCGDTAIDMLDPIHDMLVQANRRAEFAPLVEETKQKDPEAYKEIEQWLLPLLVEDARVLGSPEQQRTLVLRMAELAGDHIDAANMMVGPLRWHGELDLLIEFRQRAWADVHASDDILPHAIDGFLKDACDEIIFQALENGQPIDDKSPAMARVWDLIGKEPGAAHAAWRALVSGADRRTWTMDELRLPAVPQKPDDTGSHGKETPAFKNVRSILDQFRRHLRMEHNIPWTRADMMALEVGSYLFERARGQLGPRFGMADRMLNPDKIQKTKPFPKPEHVLCPDEETINVFGGRYFSMFSRDPYSFMALLCGMDLWLDFLLKRGLVDATRHAQALLVMRSAKKMSVKILEAETDPDLRSIPKGWEV